MIKRFILTIIAVLFTSTAWATTEMGFTSTMQSNLDAMVTASDSKYTDLKSKVDANTCSNTGTRYGLDEAWLYKATGTSSYCDLAFSRNDGCDGTANRNKTRDCFIERSLAYSLCADVVSGANKTTWESQLDAVVSLVSNAVHGTRPWDTDELMGHYFGCMIYDLAKDGTINQCTTNGISGTFGGVDSTGENTTTLRNAIDLYWSDFSSGSFVEGSDYNLNTILYTLEGVHAINYFYGWNGVSGSANDKFPEITSLFDDIADFLYQYETPDYSQHFQFGDIDNGRRRSNVRFRSLALLAIASHLDNDNTNLWDLWNDIYAESSSCGRPWVGRYNHTAVNASTKASGQSAFNAKNSGIALWHEGWNTNDTFFISRYKPWFNADHDWGTFENMAVWRNDDWVIDYPRHYYGGDWSENYWMNSVLVNGGFGRMREAVGQVAYESGSDYIYHSGVTSGFIQQRAFPENTPPWITEHAVQRLFRHNPDGTEVIFDYHRVDACNPTSTSCMTATQRLGISRGDMGGISSSAGCSQSTADSLTNCRSAYFRAQDNSWDHSYSIQADTSPSKSGDKFTWTATNGDAVELYTFMDSYTNTTADVSALAVANGGNGYSNTPYYFEAPSPSEREGYQLRITVDSPGPRTFVPILNVISIGDSGTSADSYTEIYNTSGTESVQGAMVENDTDRVVFLASAEQDLTTTFTSGFGAGGLPIFDPDRFTKASAMQKFKSDGQASFTTDDTKDIEVFIVGLDTAYTWTIQKNGVSAGCTVSANGICNFTITGAVQTHTVTWSISGAQDCDDVCSLCATEGTCDASAQTCYWHNNDGATAEQCNDTPAPSDECPTDFTQCDNQADCEFNGYCWEQNACIAECSGEPATEVDIYATADTYIDASNATTNYDTQGLKVKSSTGGGSESVNTSTFTLGGADSAYLSATSSRITASSSQRDNSTNYSYKDYGTGHFGEFDIDFAFHTGFHGSSGLVGILCLSDSAGVTMGGMNTNDDGLCVQYGRVLTPDGARIRNYEVGTPTNSSVITLSTGTYYYGSFDVTSTTATLAIYTDSARTVHATGSPVTLAVTSGATEKYQYLYGITSGGTEGTATSRSDAYVEGILINQADSGGGSSTDQNAVLRFDLSSLPAEAIIQSVYLEGKWGANGQAITGTIYAYEGSRTFVENQATWNVYSTGNNWTTAGGRGSGDIVGTWGTSTGSLASYAFSGVQVTGDTFSFTPTGSFATLVQANIGSSINIYLNQALTSTASLFTAYDSENATQANRPRLRISYFLDDEITPPVINPKKSINGGRIIGRWGN